MSKPLPAEIDCWIFDLDNTLYPPSADLFGQIDKRMSAFIQRELGVPPEHADHLRAKYWRQHGTTMAGLRLHHDVSAEHFLAEVHDIDYSGLMKDAELADAISALPGRCLVHTNGPRCHAQAVLAALEFDDLFEGVYALEDADLVSKPNAIAFETIYARAGVDPDRAAMIEDDVRNLVVPHRLALQTVWLDHDCGGVTPEHVHHHISGLTSFLQSMC